MQQCKNIRGEKIKSPDSRVFKLIKLKVGLLKNIKLTKTTEGMYNQSKQACNQSHKKFKKTQKHIHTYPELENSKSFPVLEKMITATSASQRIESSWAFLRSPFRLLENVTCLLFAFSILLISILPLPISQNQKLQRPK